MEPLVPAEVDDKLTADKTLPLVEFVTTTLATEETCDVPNVIAVDKVAVGALDAATLTEVAVIDVIEDAAATAARAVVSAV
ncbi:hypothetical protein [Nitrospirillum iridis]|uniref:Uncharacterized protein n=1 Tax=Nitrospirillum iridis TaxID=765888 RepID=A0A7X0AZ92_9PROT|nr:hypothetical protein [Nitrospirillum iridis]MBB6252873.1 hypothetical protein [Nitrospirillum iridis]